MKFESVEFRIETARSSRDLLSRGAGTFLSARARGALASRSVPERAASYAVSIYLVRMRSKGAGLTASLPDASARYGSKIAGGSAPSMSDKN